MRTARKCHNCDGTFADPAKWIFLRFWEANGVGGLPPAVIVIELVP